MVLIKLKLWPVEDDRCVPNVVKKTGTTWRKIAWKKLNVQTANTIIQCLKDFELFTIKERKYLRWNIREMCFFWKQGKLLGSIWEKAAMPLIYGGWIQPIRTTNIERSRRNWSSWKPMIDQRFRSNWKTTFSQILPSTSSATNLEGVDIQCCSPNKNTRRFYLSNTNYF